jgi:hypothetical protein
MSLKKTSAPKIKGKEKGDLLVSILCQGRKNHRDSHSKGLRKQ